MLVDPYLGPIYILKADVSNMFYHITFHPEDFSKLVLVFPSVDNREDLIIISLTIPMGWKNTPLPPPFNMATETAMDL